MTARRVRVSVRVATVLGLILTGIIATGMSTSATAAAPTDTTLKLEAKPQSTRYGVQERVKLDLTVSNTSGADCGLVDLAAGAVDVVEATRDGKALAPSFVHSLLSDGASQLIAGHLKPVPAGKSLAVPLEANYTHGIPVLTPLRDGSALTALWPVDAKGKYEFHLRYQVPSLAGDTACAGASNVAVVSFTVGDPSNMSMWLAVGGSAALLLLLLVVVLFLTRRKHRRPTPPATVVFLASLLVLSVVMSVGTATPAQANINVHDPSTSTNAPITIFWNNCLNSIYAFDPSIDQALTGTGKPDVEIFFWFYTERHDVKNMPRDSIIYWDPFPGGFLEPGVPYDPCAELYHELIHARDAATDSLSKQYCDDTGVLVDEVRAVIAENKFRKSRGLPLRTTYDGKKIPLTSVDDCTRVPPKKNAGPGTRCRSVNGRCKNGHSTGDPHMVTLDEAYYDFQAVGEFVALKAADGEVQVRQAALAKSRIVSVNSAVAVKVGDKRIGFYQNGANISVNLDGKPADVLLGQSDLGGGAALIREDTYAGTRYSVMWSDTMTVSVSPIGNWGLQLDVAVPDGRKISGLLGNFDGNKENDRPTDLYGAFADQWRVTDASSLFDYGAGQSTATFTDKSFPDKNATAPATEGAKQACRLLDIPSGPLFDACVLDVSVTGQAGFAVSVAEIASPPISSALLKGDHAVLTVTTPGGSAKTTIAATAGQRLLVQVTDTDLAAGCSPLHLLDPQGKELSTGCLGQGTGEIEGVKLPSTGDYSVVLTPVGNATGYAEMRLYLSQDEKQTLVPDKDFVATIGTPGALSRLEFAGTAGQKVFLDLPSYALPGGCGEVKLIDPDNKAVRVACAGGGVGFLDTYALEKTGTWAVEVDPAKDALGQVRMRLSFVTDITGSIAVGGPEVVSTLTQPGSKAEYSFSGTAGQKISVGYSGSTLPGGCGVVSLVDPNGFVIAVACGNESGRIDSITLPATGTYFVRIDPPDRRIGSTHIKVT